MSKTILITGATDGIGFETAKVFIKLGHRVLVHGRSEEKLMKILKVLRELEPMVQVKGWLADFSSLSQVNQMAKQILNQGQMIDVLINNAGTFHADPAQTEDLLDMRFSVNSIAPYLLTKSLMPLFTNHTRVINLSSAAQALVDVTAIKKFTPMNAHEAYA